MIEISDLKGFDFSKKYINPAKEYIEITEEYEFKCRPHLRDKKIDGSEFEFKTEFYNDEAWTSEIFPFKIIRQKLIEMNMELNKIYYLKNLFPNDNFDAQELYNVLKNERYFYVSWAILINHGINIGEKAIAQKIIDIFHKYFDISFEARFNFIENLFQLPIEEDISFNDFKNLSKNKFLKYYKKYREDSADLELVDEIFNNQEILEEKLSKFEEYRKFVYSKLDDLSSELSKYINLDGVDLINLFENITFYRGSDEDEELANILILKEFGIEEFDNINTLNETLILKEFGIEEFDNINTLNETFDFNSIKSKNIEKINNNEFKLAYINFLGKINSYHNNIDDKLHCFDDDELTPNNHCFPIEFQGTDDLQPIPVQYLKEYGAIHNHITEGKGIGVLKFKTQLNEMKKVLGKYGLSQRGSKAILIERILDNLSTEEINKEFPGHRFILTPEGEKILNDFNRYQKYISYIHTLPLNFTRKEFIQICEMNPQYDIEDIIFSIVMNNWIIIEDENLFSEDALDDINFECYINKLNLGNKLTKDFPNKAEILLFNAITISSFIAFPYIKRLCNIYHKQKKYDEELNFINLICEKAKKGLIQIGKFDSQESDWLDKRKNTLNNNLNSK